MTKHNLNTFSRNMRRRANEIGDNATRLVRRVALTVDAAVVLGTPVDTGRAKSNWIVQIGSAPTSVIDAYVPGESGSTEASNIAAATAQAESVISGYQSGRDWEIYISNNLPYIQALNDGHSSQAPAQFIEEAVAEAVAAARRARL